MDFTTLSDDELANVTKALLDELHRRQVALPDGPVKRVVGRHLDAAHLHFNAMQGRLAGGGVIQPYSGGEPKPE